MEGVTPNVFNPTFVQRCIDGHERAGAIATFFLLGPHSCVSHSSQRNLLLSLVVDPLLGNKWWSAIAHKMLWRKKKIVDVWVRPSKWFRCIYNLSIYIVCNTYRSYRSQMCGCVYTQAYSGLVSNLCRGDRWLEWDFRSLNLHIAWASNFWR